MSATTDVQKLPFDQFYEKNKGLVFKVARKVHNRVLAMGVAVELADLQQEAAIIMMRAYERFDPSLGFQFSTYFMRAAYYDLGRFLSSYEKDIAVLGVFSMEAAVERSGDEDGSSESFESRLNGGHASPEQLLEAKQLLTEIQESVSPLAGAILQVLVDPPESFENEWEQTRPMRRVNHADANLSFVGTYVGNALKASTQEVKFALQEIRSLGRSIHA